MYQTAYNTGTEALLADDLGRVIGGSEWGPVDTSSAAVKDALKADLLLLVDVEAIPEDTHEHQVNPALRDAVTSTADVNSRLEAIKATSKDDLKAALLEAPEGAETLDTMADNPDKATKAELVDAMAGRTDIDVPDAPGKTKQRGNGRSSRKD